MLPLSIDVQNWKGTVSTYTMKNEEISNGIYTAFKPMYFACKVLGLVTYSYAEQKNNNQKTAVYRAVNVVYSMVWIVFCVVAFAYTVFCLNGCDPQVLPGKLRAANYIYYTILYVTCSASFVNAILSGRRCPLIFKKLSLVDSLLFNQHEEESMSRKSMLVSVAEIVTVFVVNFLSSWLYISSNKLEICFTTCLITMERVATYLNSMAVIHYCKLVRVTHDRYKQINRRLSSCLSHAYTNNCEEHNNILRQRRVLVTQENILTSRVSPIYFRSCNGLQFRSLRNILSELNYITSLINKTYGISVLAVTCWLLVSNVIMIFFILYELEEGQYASFIYLISYYILLIDISSACDTAVSENGKSKFLVQKLLLEDDLTPKDISELKFLSLQLNDTLVVYSACGLFVLNLSFLCSVTGVIISYMIIMVQLK